MGYLKTGLVKRLAVLSTCGVLALGTVGFMKLDYNEIVPCKVLPPDSSKVEDIEWGGFVTSFTTTTSPVTTPTETSLVSHTRAVEKAVPVVTTLVETTVAPVYSKTAATTLATQTYATTTTKSVTTKKTSSTTEDIIETVAVTEETVGQTQATTMPKTTSVTTTSPAQSQTAKQTTSAKETTKQTETSSVKTTTKQTTTAPATTTTAKVTTAKTTTTAKQTTSAVTTTAKKTTTAPVTTTSPKPVNNGSTAESRLNAVATLKPNYTLTGTEDKILRTYLAKIVNANMTNYQKVVACYDYLINNTYYSYGGWDHPIESVLKNGYGTCTEYARTLAAMLNYMGFSAKAVDGQTAMAAGGYGYHMWVEIYINGQTYVMDAQVDDDMSWWAVSHQRFVKTYAEVAGQYIRN